MTDDEVKLWLKQQLCSKHGEYCTTVRLDAKAAGIKRAQLTKARAELRVKTVNLLDRSGRSSGEHLWVLR